MGRSEGSFVLVAPAPIISRQPKTKATIVDLTLQPRNITKALHDGNISALSPSDLLSRSIVSVPFL